jgi:5-hydroxyisourate hydrolase
MISTHVLDTSRGRPAAGVPVLLEQLTPNGAVEGSREIWRGETDSDGRVRELVPSGAVSAPGRFRLTFDTAQYFATLGIDGFYPAVTVVFDVRDLAQHYHVPLLLSPFGYSTYRGS